MKPLKDLEQWILTIEDACFEADNKYPTNEWPGNISTSAVNQRNRGFKEGFIAASQKSNTKIYTLLALVKEAREAIDKLLPIAHRMQLACKSGSVYDYANEHDHNDAKEYAVKIMEVKSLLSKIDKTLES